MKKGRDKNIAPQFLRPTVFPFKINLLFFFGAQGA